MPPALPVLGLSLLLPPPRLLIDPPHVVLLTLTELVLRERFLLLPTDGGAVVDVDGSFLVPWARHWW